MTLPPQEHLPNRKLVGRFEERGFAPLETFGSPIQQCVFPLLAVIKNVATPIGTAFAIHPTGILITASHVLDYASILGVWKETGWDNSACSALWALYVSDRETAGGCVGGPLPVRRCWLNDALDIAFMQVDLPVDIESGKHLTLPCIKLGLAPPQPGDRVAAFGYCEMTANEIVDGVLDYAQQTAVATAHVVETFHERRDAVLAPFPCFHIDGRFDPGMSGGPIFNAYGRACGVVCRGMTPDDNGEYLSLGAALWPAMGIPLQLSIDNRLQDTCAYDLSMRGILHIDGIEHISVSGNTVQFVTPPTV